MKCPDCNGSCKECAKCKAGGGMCQCPEGTGHSPCTRCEGTGEVKDNVVLLTAHPNHPASQAERLAMETQAGIRGILADLSKLNEAGKISNLVAVYEYTEDGKAGCMWNSTCERLRIIGGIEAMKASLIEEAFSSECDCDDEPEPQGPKN